MYQMFQQEAAKKVGLASYIRCQLILYCMVVNFCGDQIYVGFLSMEIYMQYAWCLRLIFAAPGF